MEELQDAIEDARYVTAISAVEEGPQPVEPWNTPTEEELAAWKHKVKNRNQNKSEAKPFGIDWVLSSGTGLFIFSAYLKDKCNDYVRINFIEEILRWRKLTGKYRVYKSRRIINKYLEKPWIDPETQEIKLPGKTEIDEYDMDREVPKLLLTEEGRNTLYEECIDPFRRECCIGLSGHVRVEIIRVQKSIEQMERTSSGLFAKSNARSTGSSSFKVQDVKNGEGNTEEEDKIHQALRKSIRSEGPKYLPDDFFDKADAIIVESLRRDFWSSFTESEEYAKLLRFLWYQDRQVVPEDFFTMRVLGRGGFGLVTACKKGTSGKLYAMKVMNKRRIKMKKSETLALNERKALAVCDSNFVVNLKYSFHSKEDVYLILDLMTGGDLGFHLAQKGRFPKKECVYYAARIMLGLQALHDKKYAYRDLKPENCLLTADGRVKITDLGLATKITPTLHGAAGTRGYWAPEMLRRDENRKRMPYGHTVDWFSFGCCVAEFISGTNPFRSERALKFGRQRGHEKKAAAIDCATLEMEPEFNPRKYDEDAADLCRRLLDKDETTRLGYDGCEKIMTHPWFKEVDWGMIILDRQKPPFIPAKDVNAASQSEIGTFAEDKKYQETVVTEEDEEVYKNWDWTNPRAFSAEVVEFLIYERVTGEPLIPLNQQSNCCCTIL